MSVGWGFIGAGWIAQRAMAPAVHGAAGMHLQAVASRDVERSRQLEPRTVHATYEGLLVDPDVEVVYVCLANHQHLEWVTRALAAGKHVLCEKPLALTAAEVDAMFAAAQAADRLLVEAVWSQWHPRFGRLVELTSGGDLGELTGIDSAFTFPASLEGNYRARPEFGGGAWLDVGTYQVHAWLALTGNAAEVEVETVDRAIGPTGIDVTTSVRASIGGTALADAVASFEQPERQQLVVTGSQATAALAPQASFTTWREPSGLRIGEITEVFPAVDAYERMVTAMSERVRGEAAWVVPEAQSRAAAAVLDRVASL